MTSRLAHTTPTRPVRKIRRTRKMIGLSLWLLSSLLFIAFVSYCTTWQADQPSVLGGTSAEQAANSVGTWGARLSHHFFFNGVGIFSFLIPLLVAIWGYKFLKRGPLNLRKITFNILFFIFYAASLTAFLFPNTEFPLSGATGQRIIQYMNYSIGQIGTFIVMLIFFPCLFFIVLLKFNPYNGKLRRLLDAVFFKKKVKTPAPTTSVITSKAIPPPTITPPQPTSPNNVGSLKEVTTLEEVFSTPTPLFSNANQFKGSPLNVENKETTLPTPSETPQAFSFQVIEKEIPPQSKTPPTISPIRPTLTTPPTPNFQPMNAIISPPPLSTPPSPSPNSNTTTQTSILPITTPSPSTITPPPASPQGVFLSTTRSIPKRTLLTPPTNATPPPITPTSCSSYPYDPRQDLSNYQFPPIDLLTTYSENAHLKMSEALAHNKQQIITALKNHGIRIDSIQATIGPTVTLYEIIPAPGIKVSRIRSLEDDIALSLSALSIRIIAPVPGRGFIGIEVPNQYTSTVGMKGLLTSPAFTQTKALLPIALGRTINNDPFIVDLSTMPHLLIAGATGQGKSVGINTILISLLYKLHPAELKFVLVDPKKVELNIYQHIEKHYLAKMIGEEEAIITDTQKVIYTLNALCMEMDKRYDLLKNAQTRNIKEYNDKFKARRLNPENGHQFLPFIVLVVDEFADLVMTAGKEVEGPITRLAQLARAVGIHLIIATQRPSVNIITGTIKANFPTRLSFKVSSQIDSKTILDTGGAEQLVGKGDLLISYNGIITRIQCAFISTEEVDSITQYIAQQRGYSSAFPLPEYINETDNKENDINVSNFERDKLFEEAARMVVQQQSASASNIQSYFSIGFPRASRIMRQLELSGIVGSQQGAKPREVLISTEHELNNLLDDYLK